MSALGYEGGTCEVCDEHYDDGDGKECPKCERRCELHSRREDMAVDLETLTPKPIDLPFGVYQIFAIDANGRRFPVKAYPWPDPTAEVHDRWGDKKQRIMLGGVYGTTGYGVPIRVDGTGEAAREIIDTIKRCGWADCDYAPVELPPDKPKRKRKARKSK